MRKILILGAGKSSIALIDYLVEKAGEQNWQIAVADISSDLALQKTKNRSHTQAIAFDYKNEQSRKKLIEQSDVVVSMLPATLHLTIAHDCLILRKDLVTPSYISDNMRLLQEEVKKQGLIFMNEVGLDPGIDHMSAMQIIDQLKSEGNKITGFKSHCGGLIAPESDNNLWHYKFTWNPRNVVLAGQGEGAIVYRKNSNEIRLKYDELFQHTQAIEVNGYGKFESYPNRDSLKYIAEYGLEGVTTMYRGTLRKPPFCKGWNALVKLGFTNTKERIAYQFQEEVANGMVNKSVVPDNETRDLIKATAVIDLLAQEPEKWTIPSDLLQQALEKKWAMQHNDKDMVVMVHQIEFSNADRKEEKTLQSSMVYIGKDEEHTAMATTVGLPVAMTVEMILNKKIITKGVLMPTRPEIYNPILAGLKKYNIEFEENSC